MQTNTRGQIYSQSALCYIVVSLSPFFIDWTHEIIVVLFVCLQLGVVDSPPRVFNSPYTTATSLDYNPMYRMSEFKVCNLEEKTNSIAYIDYFVLVLHFFNLLLRIQCFKCTSKS